MIIDGLDTKVNGDFNVLHYDFPSSYDVYKAIDVFDNAALCSMSKRLMLRLKYKHLYLCDDLVQIFLFVNGLDKVKNSIIAHQEPGNGQLYPGLIEYCFYEELKKD